MNRETLTAIFLGFAGGILVALLLITVPKRLPQTKKQTNPTPAQKENISDKTQINIESPIDGSYIEGNSVEISGTASGKTTIVANGPIEDKVTTSGEDGKFKISISVTDGENNISVSSYPADGAVITKSLIIFASKEVL